MSRSHGRMPIPIYKASLSVLLSVLIATGGVALGPPAAAQPIDLTYVWDSRADFEDNASTTAEATTIEGLSTSARPGEVILAAPPFSAVAAGGYHTVGLKSDGSVQAVGQNTAGQCDVFAWTDIAAVSAGLYNTLVLKSDGSVENTGWSLPGVSGWSDIVAISAGGYHAVGLRSDGTVVATGQNAAGQCNVSGWNDIVAVSAGFDHTVGLKSDGTVVAAGDDTYGKATVSGWSDIVAVSAGGSHTVGLESDGTAVAVGRNIEGQCDVSAWNDITAISASLLSHTVALKADGSVLATGDNSAGQCNVTNWDDIIAMSAGRTHTVALKDDGTIVGVGNDADGRLDVSPFIAAAAGYEHTVGVMLDGTVAAVGSNTYGQCNVAGWSRVVAATAGHYHTVGVKSDGTAIAVGNNDWGQCDVSAWTDIVAVAAGWRHTVGVKSDGTVVAAGDNSYDQCNVSTWTDITAVATTYEHTAGLRADGTVVAVGNNASGQIDVPGWEDIVDVAAGWYHTVGLKSDGTVVAIGSDSDGQREGVFAWSSAVGVSAGAAHTVGLRADGRVMAVGRNDKTQCDVTGWADVVATAAGGNHTVGLRGEGGVVAVGDNDEGQLGVSDWQVLDWPARRGTIGGEGDAVGLRVDAGGTIVGGTLSAEVSRLVPGEAVKLAVRTSDDGETWSAPLGRDGDPVVWNGPGANYFGSAAGDLEWFGDLDPLPDARFLDIVVRLQSGGVSSPALDSVSVTLQVEEDENGNGNGNGQMFTLTELSGPTRYETAVEVSKAAYPAGLDPAGTRTVLVATGRRWPDALGGTALAGVLDGPILLTDTNTVPGPVLAEISRLGAARAIVLGGPDVVSVGVESTLVDLLGPGNVERIAGESRYDTAEAVAARVKSLLGPTYDGTAFVATGAKFPDALAAAPLAAAGGWPIYLAHPTQGLSASTTAEMAGAARVLVLGGPDVVSEATADALAAAFGEANVTRLAGTDRYATAQAVASFGVTEAGLSWDGVGIALGQRFPDALAGGVLQGKSGAPVLLTRTDALPVVTANALADNRAAIRNVTVFGGLLAISQDVRDAIVDLLR